MVQRLINTAGRKMCINVTIKCKGTARFRVVAAEHGRPNSRYADRCINVPGERTIFLSFPVSPEITVLSIANIVNPGDQDFEVVLEEKPLREYAVWLDEDTRDFLTLATRFSQTCGYKRAHHMGTMASTRDGKFRIKFFPQITDFMTGQVQNTPARIGHTSGIIEVAKSKFDYYTIGMRMCILLHEFSHKYRNPKNNLPVSNEQGADINSLYIFLGLGYSKIDAIRVYAHVFLKAQTKQNIERMRVIMDYIKRFEAQEFAQLA